MLRSSCSRSQGQSRRSRRVIASSSSSASPQPLGPALDHRSARPSRRLGARRPAARPAARRPARAPGHCAGQAAAPAAPFCGAPPSASGALGPPAPPGAPPRPPARRRPPAGRCRSRCRRRCRRRALRRCRRARAAPAPVEPGTGFFWPGGTAGRRGLRRLTAVAAVGDHVLLRAVGARAPVVAEARGELVELLLLLLRDQQLADALLGLLEALLGRLA